MSYEVFEGNRADITPLEEILDAVARKHGALGRVWVFDRGIVSEENLALLRQRGAFCLVATPQGGCWALSRRNSLKEDWSQVEGHPQTQLKLVERRPGGGLAKETTACDARATTAKAADFSFRFLPVNYGCLILTPLTPALKPNFFGGRISALPSWVRCRPSLAWLIKATS